MLSILFLQKYFFFTTFHLKIGFSCKKLFESFVVNTKSATFALAKANMVRWMSGLVTGLQNRLHPFESGTHLQKQGSQFVGLVFF